MPRVFDQALSGGWIAAGLSMCFLADPVSAAPLRWHETTSYRWAALEVPTGKTGFTLLRPEQTGIDFRNDIEGDESLNGAGVALGDFNNDGLCDIYFTALHGRHRLYKNLGGWKFQDVTEGSGVECDGQFGKGACFVDLNGDRNLDLVVTATRDPGAKEGGLRSFLGDGKGKFRENTAEAGLACNFGSHTIAAADIDGNGTIDLYVSNAGATERQEQKRGYYETIGGRQVYSWVRYDANGRVAERIDLPIVQGRPTVPAAVQDRFFVESSGEVKELGPPDLLLVGDGSGKFTRASWTDGRFVDEDGKPLQRPPFDFGLAATFRDFNGDGAPDIYVCNDFHTPDRLWFGDGAGRFRAAPRLALRSLAFASMGVDVGDLNRDGHADFLVVEMLARSHERRKRQMNAVKLTPIGIGEIENQPQWMRNMLYLNRGDATWAEVANFAGLAASEWSWQPLFIDIDLDGYEDVFVSNGYGRDMLDADIGREAQALAVMSAEERQKIAGTYPVLNVPKVAFRNRGDLTFEEKGAEWGLATPGVGQGVAEADLDNDGDLDLVMNMYRDYPAVYRNNAPNPRVAVRLRGRGGNWQGIGAKVTLRGGAVPVQTREVFCGGRYHSGGDPQLCFAAGRKPGVMKLEVLWRNGTRSDVDNVGADRIYEISEPALPND